MSERMQGVSGLDRINGNLEQRGDDDMYKLTKRREAKALPIL